MEHNNPLLPQNVSKPTKMLLPELADKVNYTLATYGSFQEFSHTFALTKMPTYVRFPQRCVCGTAPTMMTCAEAYGTNSILQWLMTLFVGTSEFSGAKEKITPYQLEKLANKFYDRAKDLKVTEVMLFIDKLESGDFGRFSWHSFDPVAVLDKIENYRNFARRLVERDEEQQREAQAEIDRQRAVPCPPHIAERLKRLFHQFHSNNDKKQ